jgi:hypothetical protein
MARLKFPGVGKNSLQSQSPKKRLVLKIRRKKEENPESFNVTTKQAISQEEFNKIFGDSDEEVRIVILLNRFFQEVSIFSNYYVANTLSTV